MTSKFSLEPEVIGSDIERMTTIEGSPPGKGSQALKEKQRQVRDGFPDALALRVHRSLSWLLRAEAETEDDDVRFILLWIGVNSAYAADFSLAQEGRNERHRLQTFFDTLYRFDARFRIEDMIWDRFSGEISQLMANPFVFSPFWQHHNGVPGYEDWEDRLTRSLGVIRNAMKAHDTPKMLSLLFDRLYVLRNQLVHGGATWNSEVNRRQVKDGADLLGCLLPIFIDLMMDNPRHAWDAVNYPVVKPDEAPLGDQP